MQNERSSWSVWAQFLHRWGLNDLVAGLLEGSSGLHLLAAQLLYIGKPVLGSAQWDALAEVLEDPAEARSFAAYLREENRVS